MGVAFMMNPSSLTNPYVKLGEVLPLGGAEASMAINGIASGYKHLILYFEFTPAAGAACQINFNGDNVGANYSYQIICAAGAVLSSLADNASATYISDLVHIGAARVQGFCVIENLAGMVKQFTAVSGGLSSQAIYANSWKNNTDEINSIVLTLSGAVNFSAGSKMVLYGV
jgi:hypothetical protein